MKNNSREYYRVTLVTQCLDDEYGDLIYYNRWFFFADYNDAIDFYDSHYIGEKIDDCYIIADIQVEFIRRIQ